MAQAPVNRILPFSAVDGPGSRAAVFLQGCNFRCAYCHNPETRNLCDGCGACVPGCPSGALQGEAGKVLWDPQKCLGCDACLSTCSVFASPKVRLMSASEVHEILLRSLPFIRGITVSGGECCLYPDFLTELFSMTKKDGLGNLIDTNGSVELSLYPGLVDLCDGVMLDVKSWDCAVHRSLTGCDNGIVKKNLGFLAEREKLAELRIVCLEGEVDAPSVIEGIAGALGRENTKKVLLKLIRFRRYGVRGRLEGARSPDQGYMDALVASASTSGFERILLV